MHPADYAATHLTEIQVRVLRTLNATDRDIAAALGSSVHGVRAVLGWLAAKGLVKRQPDGSWRRIEGIEFSEDRSLHTPKVRVHAQGRRKTVL